MQELRDNVYLYNQKNTKDAKAKTTKLGKFRIIIPEFGQQHLTRRCIESLYKTDNAILFNNIANDFHPPHYYNNILVGNDGWNKLSGKETNIDRSPISILYNSVTTNLACRINWTKNLHFAGNVNRTINYLMLTDIDNSVEDIETIVIVNSDITFTNGALSNIIHLSQQKNALVGPAVIVPGPYVSKDHGPHIQMFSHIGYATRERFISNSIVNATAISGCCFAVPVEWWRKVRGFDSNIYKAYFEDDDISIRANIDNIPVLVNYDALVMHDVNQSMPNAQSNKNNTIRESKKAFAAKWPEIKWNPTGMYNIPLELNSNDRRIQRKYTYEELAFR